MDDKIAVKVDGVYKNFKLPHEKADTVKGLFTNAFRYIRKARTYETQHALKDISFEVKKGEFFGIVGRNGSGKSTLLKMLAGIYQPNQGSIQINGKLVPFIELGVGFNAELTGRENVYLNGALLGFTKKEIDDRYNDIVAFAELEAFMDQKLKNYSSGMQVRLAFSLAIRAETDILLVDEVLAVGDADFQRKCFNHFRKLKKEKKTVVFVSHDMNAIREYCDRAIMIEKSEMVASGEPETIATKYARMFTEKSHIDVGSESKRWGDGSARFESVTISPKTLRKPGMLTVTAPVEIKEKLEKPVFGITVKSPSGGHLFGTNTRIKHLKTADFKPGDRVVVTWEIPHIFDDGEFTLDMAVVRNNGTECDWWEDAASFTVYKDERTPYSIAPEIGVNVSLTKPGE